MFILCLNEFANDVHALAGAILFLDLIATADGFVLGHGLAHFGKREVFQLANAFTGDVKFFADFLKRKFIPTL